MEVSEREVVAKIPAVAGSAAVEVAAVAVAVGAWAVAATEMGGSNRGNPRSN